jgi:hypothetical protein
MTKASFVDRFPKAWDRQEHLSMIVEHVEVLGQNIFVCRYLPTNKNSSLCSPRLCGDNLVLDRHEKWSMTNEWVADKDLH